MYEPTYSSLCLRTTHKIQGHEGSLPSLSCNPVVDVSYLVE